MADNFYNLNSICLSTDIATQEELDAAAAAISSRMLKAVGTVKDLSGIYGLAFDQHFNTIDSIVQGAPGEVKDEEDNVVCLSMVLTNTVPNQEYFIMQLTSFAGGGQYETISSVIGNPTGFQTTAYFPKQGDYGIYSVGANVDENYKWNKYVQLKMDSALDVNSSGLLPNSVIAQRFAQFMPLGGGGEITGDLSVYKSVGRRRSAKMVYSNSSISYCYKDLSNGISVDLTLYPPSADEGLTSYGDGTTSDGTRERTIATREWTDGKFVSTEKIKYQISSAISAFDPADENRTTAQQFALIAEALSNIMLNL